MGEGKQPGMFDAKYEAGLPLGKKSKPRFFEVDRIILAKGSCASPERKRFIEEVAALYPSAQVIEALDKPHNRIELGERDPAKRVSKGKRTLVFGEHKSAVRQSTEEGNTCPNYWHFSPYGFCFYGCKYCYLSGTRGVWHSPTIKIFLNLDEIIGSIDKAARGLARPTAFYLGKLQDGLALDPLTGYCEVLVPFFADHPYARQTLLTKCDDVDRLLGLDHKGHTILSWSLTPPEVASRFEDNVPDVDDRIEAMKKCAKAGYPVRAVIMPVIPSPGWDEIYPSFIRRLVSEVALQRLTIGGICIYKNARRLMDKRLGRSNSVSDNIDESGGPGDGRARYAQRLRTEMYKSIFDAAKETRPDPDLALCLEDKNVWNELDMIDSQGRCNCVL